MSVNKNTYGILGFDLTGHKEQLLTEEFQESSLYDDLTCYQREGKVQLFTDPMSSEYLYFGYIFFKTDDSYCEVMSAISVSDMDDIAKDVNERLFEHFGLNLQPQVIVFNEFT